LAFKLKGSRNKLSGLSFGNTSRNKLCNKICNYQPAISLSTNLKADESHFLHGLKQKNAAPTGLTVYVY